MAAVVAKGALKQLMTDALYRTVASIDVEIRFIARGVDGEIVAEQPQPTVLCVEVAAFPLTIQAPTFEFGY